MFEIAPEIQVTSISSGGSSVTLFGGVANAIFNFASSGTAVPFIELGLGYSTLTGGGGGSDLHTAILPRLGGGVRILVGNSASVNIGATYEHLSTSVSGGGGSLGGNQFGVNVGLSIFPSGLK